MIDHGMFRLLHHLSLGAFVMTNGSPESASEKPYLENDMLRQKAVSIVRETMEAYLSDQTHRLVSDTAYPLDDGGFMGACELSFSIKLFVIAHELAHVELGHLDNTVNDPSREERQAMEFAADSLAQETLIRIDQEFPTGLALLGGGLAFLLCDLIRNYVFSSMFRIRPELSSKSGDHPAPLARIERIDSMLQAYFKRHPDRSRDSLSSLKLLQWIAMDLEPS